MSDEICGACVNGCPTARCPCTCHVTTPPDENASAKWLREAAHNLRYSLSVDVEGTDKQLALEDGLCAAADELERLEHLHKLDHSLADQWQQQLADAQAANVGLKAALEVIVPKFLERHYRTLEVCQCADCNYARAALAKVGGGA